MGRGQSTVLIGGVERGTRSALYRSFFLCRAVLRGAAPHARRWRSRQELDTIADSDGEWMKGGGRALSACGRSLLHQDTETLVQGVVDQPPSQHFASHESSQMFPAFVVTSGGGL
ncbi:unnamed protein product [Lota lota]